MKKNLLVPIRAHALKCLSNPLYTDSVSSLNQGHEFVLWEAVVVGPRLQNLFFFFFYRLTGSYRNQTHDLGLISIMS